MTQLLSATFSAGNLNEFTGSANSTGETVAASTDFAHHDTYSCKSTSNGGGSTEYGYVYYDPASAKTTLYARAYFKISTFAPDATGEALTLIRFRNGTTMLAKVGLYYTSSAIRWWLESRNGTSYVDTRTTTFDKGTDWFCLELYWVSDATTGTATMWVDGTQIYSHTDDDTDNYGGVTRVGFGGVEVTNMSTSTLIYCDCCVVDDSTQIGQESTVTDKGAADTVGASDAYLIGYKEMPVANSIDASDAYLIPYKELPCAMSSISVNDVFALTRSLNFADSVTLADSLAILYKALGYSEAVAVSDAYLLLQMKSFAETGHLADAFAIVYKSLTFIDYVNMADVFNAATIFKMVGFTDTTTLNDAFALLNNLGFSDNIHEAEAFAITYQTKAFNETLTLSDAYAIVYKTMGFSQTISVSDVFNLFNYLNFSDSVTASDAYSVIATLLSKSFGDTLTVNDVFAITFKLLQFADSVNIADVQANTYRAMTFTDTVHASDVYQMLLSLLQFSDTVSASDVYATLLRLVNVTDAVVVNDAYEISFKEMRFADTILAGDAVSILYRLISYSENVALLTAFTKLITTYDVLFISQEIIHQIDISEEMFNQIEITEEIK